MADVKTIKDLLNAAPLSDGDFLVVNQPNVFNSVTQQNGDTRRVTVRQLAHYTRVVGEYHELAFSPTPVELAIWRYLPLQYQIIEIALYQALCDRKWVGSAANNSALFWYKCDLDGTRNVDGLYMRVEDGRGLFHRGAGANAILKAANDTPYDGGQIGSFIGDTIRDITGSCYPMIDGSTYEPVYAFSGAMHAMRQNVPVDYVAKSGPGVANLGIGFKASLVVPTASENRPASTSVYTCISY